LAQAGTGAFGPGRGVGLVLVLGGTVWGSGNLLLPRARVRRVEAASVPQTVHNGQWRGRHRAPMPAINPRALLGTVTAAVNRRGFPGTATGRPRHRSEAARLARVQAAAQRTGSAFGRR
ncbi:MAG TPA: hypothetical protein VJT31_20735, partial [Rugosimonospora sp.]|nr:hypothetical protein [Rugosimonospora sp.]